ncbi:MAG: hypothetical protein VCD66_01810 [Alphaproteobacteria bacterium]|jgi:hypothetical protein
MEPVNDVRQFILAVPLFLALVVVFLPLRAMGDGATCVAGAGTAAEPGLQRPADSNSAANHVLVHANLDGCQAEAGHCAPGLPVIPADGQGKLAIEAKAASYRINQALATGLQLLPLLPPPERA